MSDDALPLARGGLARPRNKSNAMRVMALPESIQHVDWILVGATVIVSVLGVLMVYSATRGSEPPYDTSFLKKQFMFLVLGGFALAAAALVDYRKIRDVAPFVYAASVGLLVLVKSPLGSNQNGTQGWFQIGPFQLQPSAPCSSHRS